jgi:hypothetical protein
MNTTDNQTPLGDHLDYLKLHFFRDNYASLAKKAAQKQWDHTHYLGELASAEANQRKVVSVQPASLRSRPSSSLDGTGPKRSTRCRCKTCSASGS